MKAIIFKTEMVRAILDGRKTCTRRVAFPNGDLREFPRPDNPDAWWFRGRVYKNLNSAMRSPQGVLSLCKYKNGDILYVRETWQFIPCIDCGEYSWGRCNHNAVIYEDKDSINEGCFVYLADYPERERIAWRPSTHMPKEAARLFLRVTDVRVEHLQDITEEQARAEGAEPFCLSTDGEDVPDSERTWHEVGPALWDFIRIWDSTIKPADIEKYGWDANPFVWVIEFERYKLEENET